MKKWKVSLYFFIMTAFYANVMFSQLATVNSWDAVLEPDNTVNKENAIALIPGSVVEIDKKQGDYSRVSINNKTGRIRTEYLDFYPDLFSNVKSKDVLSRKIVKEDKKYYLFYHKDGLMVKYNITDRAIESARNAAEFQEFYPSPRSDLFLLKGVFTNAGNINNMTLYNFSSGKSVYLGSFNDEAFDFVEMKFSDDADYLAVVFSVKGKYIACVYKTDNGAMTAFAKEARNINWKNDMLILNDRKNFWYCDFSVPPAGPDISFNKDNLLFKIKPEWLNGGRIGSRVKNDFLYLETRNGVLAYDFENKKFQQTPLHSLIFNDDLSLNYYVRNERASLYNISAGIYLPQFKGSQPEVGFIGFSLTNMIGRGKYEKIDTLFMYSPEGREIYRYKAIDEPMAMSENGIIAEMNADKDMTIITIEDPEKQEFFYIFEKGKK